MLSERFRIRKMKLVFGILFVFVFSRVNGLPDGAPQTACSTMTPGHGVNAETSTSPFSTVLTPDNGGVRVTLTVNSQGYSYFKGYLTMAFDASTATSSDPIGYFSETDSRAAITPGKYLTCPSTANLEKNAATHADNSEKYIVNLLWKPSNGFKGNVTFKTTFVYNTTIFWVKTSSDTVYVERVDPTLPPTLTTPGGNASIISPSFNVLSAIMSIILVVTLYFEMI